MIQYHTVWSILKSFTAAFRIRYINNCLEKQFCRFSTFPEFYNKYQAGFIIAVIWELYNIPSVKFFRFVWDCGSQILFIHVNNRLYISPKNYRILCKKSHMNLPTLKLSGWKIDDTLVFSNPSLRHIAYVLQLLPWLKPLKCISGTTVKSERVKNKFVLLMSHRFGWIIASNESSVSH